eukprot:1146781-Pelagomonas_calceolata.AAC.7
MRCTQQSMPYLLVLVGFPAAAVAVGADAAGVVLWPLSFFGPCSSLYQPPAGWVHVHPTSPSSKCGTKRGRVKHEAVQSIDRVKQTPSSNGMDCVFTFSLSLSHAPDLCLCLICTGFNILVVPTPLQLFQAMRFCVLVPLLLQFQEPWRMVQCPGNQDT